MYQLYITIPACAEKQFFSFGIAGLGGLDLSFGLFLEFLEVFGGETGADIGSIALLPAGYVGLLMLGIMPRVELSILRAVAIIDHFFDLMLDLLFGYGAIGGWRVLTFRLLLAVEGFQEGLIWRFWLLFYGGLLVHHNRLSISKIKYRGGLGVIIFKPKKEDGKRRWREILWVFVWMGWGYYKVDRW